TVTNNQIAGFAGPANTATIFYSAAGGAFTNGGANDGLRLLGSDAFKDFFNVQSTLLGSTTEIDGNGDDDTFDVSSDAPANAGNLDAILGTLTVDAGAGAANRLIASDFGGAANPAVVVTNSQITGLAPASIFYFAT